jgi:mannitol/fructose-specific phosphotransferase system IIA component
VDARAGRELAQAAGVTGRTPHDRETLRHATHRCLAQMYVDDQPVSQVLRPRHVAPGLAVWLGDAIATPHGA